LTELLRRAVTELTELPRGVLDRINKIYKMGEVLDGINGMTEFRRGDFWMGLI
jgi:hypothetical protein